MLSQRVNKSASIYAIGNNKLGEFGLGHTSNRAELTKLTINKDNNFDLIYSGNQYTFYCDKEHRHILVAGDNRMNQCADYKPSKYKHIMSIILCKTVQYFIRNNINIQKICVNPTSHATFWLSIGRVYANGWNLSHQLGLKDTTNRIEPTLIKSLKNTLDIQCGYDFSIALCSGTQAMDIDIIWMIIEYWFRISMITNTQYIPDDVLKTINKFHTTNDHNRVWVTSTIDILREYFINIDCWKEKHMNKHTFYSIPALKKQKIVKIRCGKNHCLFLSEDGVIWSCGHNNYGQRGWSSGHRVSKIKYFIDNEIKIKDIECGASHNLAVDVKGNLYSWGYNVYGQCGDGTRKNVLTPKQVDLRGHIVKNIQCGSYHSYCLTDDGRHWLWGRNENNECMAYNNKKTKRLPHSINKVVKQKCDNRRIKAVFLGHNNTKLLVYDQ